MHAKNVHGVQPAADRSTRFPPRKLGVSLHAIVFRLFGLGDWSRNGAVRTAGRTGSDHVGPMVVDVVLLHVSSRSDSGGGCGDLVLVSLPYAAAVW